MAEQRPWPVFVWGGLALLAAALFATRLVAAWPATSGDATAELGLVIFFHGVLPRAAVALVAGAALALSGLLLQRVLRNQLAEPSTLGVSAGAQLAMALATLYAPWAMDLSVSLVAFSGGVVAVGLILCLTWQRGLEPVAVVLSGMMVALTANAASAALILINGDYLFSLFIWGGGSLVQQGWEPTIAVALRLALGVIAALLLLRPLAVLGLDDASARSLGIALNASRLLVIGLAVWLATTVVAEVGVIGFVGLAAPALATLSGARTLRQKMIAAPLIGALLLFLADGLVQATSGPGGERVPAGAATALLGGPLLLWLLPKLRLFEWPSIGGVAASARRASRPVAISFALAGCVLIAAGIALAVGQGPDGWVLATGSTLTDLAAFRAPRTGVAAAAGMLLAAAGFVVQRVTSNPLASPEVLGVGTGAGAGLAAALILGSGMGLAWQFGASVLGAAGVLVAILAFGARSQFGPERLIFAGIAMNALCSSVLTAVIALGNVQSYTLLRWLVGSTSDATPLQSATMLVAALLATLALLAAGRWLDVLPLGSATARALGVPLAAARGGLVLVAAIATAGAALVVGPLSFVGLIAPHLARMIGLGRARQHLVGSVLIGAILMIVSDWLARMAAFPYQLPVGLFASLLGGPYLVYLLAKGVPRHG